MEKFEIKPKLFNVCTVLPTLGILLTAGILNGMVLPVALELYRENPSEAMTLELLIFFGIGNVVLLFIIILIFVYYQGKKIKVEDKLVYFYKKTKLGFGVWKIERVIDFSKVASVKDRQKITYVFTGKSMTPISYYWLIFEKMDGEKEELLLNGWDAGGVKNLFYYLKGKFPTVSFNTHILRDSSEKLSGIDKLSSK